MRAHYYRPVTDDTGNLLPNVQVTLYQPATTTPISDVVYSTDTGNNVLSNPWVANNGVIDLYLDNPQRVRIGIVQGGLAPVFYEDVDVLAAGSDSEHVGAGASSLVIGVGAVSAGDQSTALGPTATSPGQQSTALGSASNSLGPQSIAIGAASTAGAAEIAIGDGTTTSGGSSVALGDTSSATGASSVALGANTAAAWAHSTAIGPDAATQRGNQIMLGTPTDVTEIPAGSGLVMSSPNGTRYILTITDTGALDSEIAT